MEEKPPGYRFSPYEEELVGYYLHHKIHGNNSLVDGIINVIDIYSVDPWNLRFQSREPVLYFFSRRENKYANGNQRRTTPSGFWKMSGKPRNVIDRWGHWSGSRGKMIGYKKVLSFTRGKNNSISAKDKKTKSEWVMHEFQYTLLPENERTYVVCRLKYKGNDVNILSAYATDPTPTFVPNMANSASSVVNQSYQGNSGYCNPFPEYQDQQFSRIFDMFQASFQGYSDNPNPTSDYGLPNQSNWSSDHLNLEQPLPYSDWKACFQSLESELMRDDCSNYAPKKPVTRYVYSSDSDTDSMIGRDDAWSSTDSVGSKDDDTPSLITVEPLHNHEPQEQPKQQLELPLQGKDKVMNKQKSECEWKMAEDLIKKAPSTSAAVKQSWIVLEEISPRSSRWVYLKNITGLLLFIFIIGWITLAG